MPWFRRLRKSTDAPAEQTAAAAPQEVAVPAEQPVTVESETTASVAESGEQAKRKRRRGSRGGRGRTKSPGGESPESEDGADEPAATTAKADRAGRSANGDARRAGSRAPAKDAAARAGERKDGQQRRRSGATQQRRKQPPRRAPLPAAKRELLITHDVGEQRVAILEDDRVAEVFLERPESRSIVGNIYLGTVDNVLPGMEAAFVEIGLEKNGFLYVDEIVVPELEGKRHGKKIQDLISRGEKLLVQAVKDPMKTKGARLTTEISLPGRFLVLVPNGEGLGVSRRLEDAERQRLKDILKPLAPKEGGVIVRTAAEGASAEDVERDLVFLQRLWKTIQSRSETAKAPELVYQEAELPLRIVRDLFAGDFVAAHVDNDRAHKRIVGYLKKTSPHMVERVHRWKEKERLFDQFGVEQEIASTLDRRVDLPSGGYLIFDYAEAFTVVDVNTGRFVGSRSKTSTGRLEDTIVKNNLEAVKEVVRQLRLRDIGGIIVIDFIDMANAKNREAVEEALRTELERDRTKTYVVEISPLGLVEMTRQNVTDGPREVMTRKCPTCGGDGIVVSDQTVAMQVERKLRALAAGGAGSRVQAYRVAVHPRTLSHLAGPGGQRLAELEEATRRRFFLVGADGHAHGDHFEVLAEGKLDDLRPTSPVEEGAEVEVKLVEVGLYDVAAGVAKLDGVDVIVADAAKLVGKKATVVIGRALDGQAFASRAAGAGVPAAITFESEAEKPTRAPARRKGAEEPAALVAEPASEDGAAGSTPSVDEDAVADASDADELGDTDEDEGEAAVGEDGTPVKRKTRRGSRGGRRRKKPAAAGSEPGGETEADAADGEETDDVVEASAGATEESTETAPAPARAAAAPKARAAGTRRAPRIHLPEDEGRARREDDAPAVDEPSAPTAELAAAPTTEPTAEVDLPETASDGDGDAPPTAAKKRTRRGSRGGRNRRKKPAGTAAEGEAEADSDAGSDSEAGESPAEAVVVGEADRSAEPDAPLDEPEPAGVGATVADEVTPAAEPAVLEEVVEDEPVVAEPPEQSARDTETSDGGDGYVPMSEWIDDFDRR